MEKYTEFEGVMIEHPERTFLSLSRSMVPLADLYKQGWWITEIFGTQATVVKKSKHYSKTRPDFCTRSVHLAVEKLTPAAIRKIKKISNEQWKLYKRIMLRKLYKCYTRY